MGWYFLIKIFLFFFVELATDATKLATENWGLILEICDFINNTDEGLVLDF